MTLEAILSSLNSGPVWAFAGILATKGFDWLISQGKAKGDYTAQMAVATNASHQMLVESLFAQIKNLDRNVEELRGLYEKERLARLEAERRVALLEFLLARHGITSDNHLVSPAQEETGPHT